MMKTIFGFRAGFLSSAATEELQGSQSVAAKISQAKELVQRFFIGTLLCVFNYGIFLPCFIRPLRVVCSFPEFRFFDHIVLLGNFRIRGCE
jgi:hypothetical protein